MEEEVQKRRSKSSDRGSSRERIRRRRSSRSKSRSRPRNVRRSRSRSISPLRSGWSGGFRGGRRFNRRSPPYRGGRGFGRDRFRRSRSASRGRYENRRRYDEHDHRRSRSASPNRSNNFTQQQPHQQQPLAMAYGNEAYANYGVPQFPGSMAQFNTYDFQAYPPAPNFDMNTAMGMTANCPAPPGLADWQPPQAPTEPDIEKQKREAAIAEEKKRQREGLKKQRDQYISRSEKMKRELKMLKEQKSGFLDGLGKRSPSPKTSGFIKENDKLQTQISTKLSEVLNVIDMLNGIIGKESDEEEDRKESDSDSSPERIKNKLLESMGKKKEVDEKKQKVNYIYYDPELHWCKPCQAFPKTAQDYLNHLHTKEHLEKIANRTTEAPWRAGFQKINEVPTYPNAPTKRAPIKGLQFFEPATAWFCKLCEMFMGDSWCTSLHLKSAIHAERYAKFIEKEPKFEEKWLEARNKAFENFGCLDSIVEKHQKASIKEDSNDKKSLDKKKKKKNKKDSKKKRKRGKKRKHSSSSSDSDDDSDSSSSSDSASKKDGSNSEGKNSIRVAMRNFANKGNNESEKSGWTMVSLDPNKPPIPPPPAISQNASKETKKDEQIINQWNTVEPIISQEEKRLLENLKGRYKQNKQENGNPVAIPSPPQVSSRRKSRDRSRSKERRNERNFRGRKSRSRSKSPLRRRSNSRDRRRSNSRDRRRSNSRDRRRSNSRDRRRSPRYGRRYSRSRSRSPRFTRPHIVFPTEPRLPPLREEKKQPARSYVITKKEEPQATSSALANASKKMPIIGKMPVFKKLTTEKKSETQTEEKSEEKQVNSAETLEEKNNLEDWNDLMPDPMQYTAMMSAAQPVPPVVNEQPDAPPGLDPEMDSEFIPKPINDAPPPRKGPLPKDLQATLDILFDGDSIKPVVMEPAPIEAPLPVAMPIDNDGPQMIMAEEISQHSILYTHYDIQPVPAPPVISKKSDTENEKKKDEYENDVKDERNDEKQKNEDIDDLAMLGIDVNDVGSGLW